jgi:hypothetical protein
LNMDLNTPTENVFAARNIRRHPTELDHVTSRGIKRHGQTSRHLSFSEVAATVNGREPIPPTPTQDPAAAQEAKPFTLWQKDRFGFADFIDIINPLQHIPIVATIYRKFTGDHIAAAPRVIGGALWGRIGGFVSGLANALVEWWSGKDIGDHIYTAVFSPSKKDANSTVTARSEVTPSVEPVGPTAIREPSKPRTDHSAIATSTEAHPTVRESDAVGANALCAGIPPIPHAAHRLYEKNRRWGEPDESLGVRFPA